MDVIKLGFWGTCDERVLFLDFWVTGGFCERNFA
jgi:hypothetical protein